jgi:hypothetical protein
MIFAYLFLVVSSHHPHDVITALDLSASGQICAIVRKDMMCSEQNDYQKWNRIGENLPKDALNGFPSLKISPEEDTIFLASAAGIFEYKNDQWNTINQNLEVENGNSKIISFWSNRRNETKVFLCASIDGKSPQLFEKKGTAFRSIIFNGEAISCESLCADDGVIFVGSQGKVIGSWNDGRTWKTMFELHEEKIMSIFAYEKTEFLIGFETGLWEVSVGTSKSKSKLEFRASGEGRKKWNGVWDVTGFQDEDD